MQKNSNKQKYKQEKYTKSEKRTRRIKVIKLIIKIFIFIALLVGLVAFAFTSPLFNITEIDVEGNEKFEDEVYITLSELNIGENIFNFSKLKVISKIENNPYVDEVSIKRKLPSKLKITIKERVATYLINLGDEYAYINNQGYILEISKEKLPLTIITGISTEIENIIEGNRLNNEDLERLQAVIQIKDSMNDIQMNRELSSIDITNKSDYFLTFDKEAKDVRLGDTTNLSSKILFIKYVLDEQEGVPGTIYLNQSRTYFSPK